MMPVTSGLLRHDDHASVLCGSAPQALKRLRNGDYVDNPGGGDSAAPSARLHSRGDDRRREEDRVATAIAPVVKCG